MRILLLEDDLQTAKAITAGLSASGYEVRHAGNVQDAQSLLADERIDAAVLDLMIPGGSGYDILRAIRARSAIPVLILTAREEVSERVEGLVLQIRLEPRHRLLPPADAAQVRLEHGEIAAREMQAGQHLAGQRALRRGRLLDGPSRRVTPRPSAR